MKPLSEQKILPVTQLGPTRIGEQITVTMITPSTVYHKTSQGITFPAEFDEYPIEGAKAEVTTQYTGHLKRQYIVTVVISLADGSRIVHVLTGAGYLNSIRAAEKATRFGMTVNKLGSSCPDGIERCNIKHAKP